MTAGAIAIDVNGERRSLPAAMNIVELLETLSIDRRMVAVAHNGEIVPRAEHDQTVVRDGDTIEIVRMVGGG